MQPLPLAKRRFNKICWVVDDLDAAMQGWIRSAGVGPFFCFDKVVFENARYRGRPAEPIEITAAFANAGDFLIELVSQHDDRPSFFRDVVPAGHTGLHHMQLYSNNYEADFVAYTAAGAEVAFDATMMGARNCWLDTRATLGFMLQLLEMNAAADAVFGKIRDAGINWDGQDPIRKFS